MRKLRHVLGWIVTVAAAVAFVAIRVAAELAQGLIPAVFPFNSWIGTLIAIVIVGGCAAFWLHALFGREGRAARRERQAERAERRRKLENFEL